MRITFFKKSACPAMLLLGLLLSPTQQASAGPVFDSLTAACVASGSGNLLVTFVPQGTISCAQACQAAYPANYPSDPSAKPICNKVWGVWPDKSFQYSAGCDGVIHNTTANFKGTVCCCKSPAYPLPPQDAKSPFPY